MKSLNCFCGCDIFEEAEHHGFVYARDRLFLLNRKNLRILRNCFFFVQIIILHALICEVTVNLSLKIILYRSWLNFLCQIFHIRTAKCIVMWEGKDYIIICTFVFLLKRKYNQQTAVLLKFTSFILMLMYVKYSIIFKLGNDGQGCTSSYKTERI